MPTSPYALPSSNFTLKYPQNLPKILQNLLEKKFGIYIFSPFSKFYNNQTRGGGRGLRA